MTLTDPNYSYFEKPSRSITFKGGPYVVTF